MKRNPTWLAVVALALFDPTGRVLLQQRPAGKHHAGLWEFPGGKVEEGETPRTALVREIAEELGLTLDPTALSPALVADEAGDRPIVLILYTGRDFAGTPRGLDGQRWAWHTLEEAADLPLAPMDRDLLERMSR